MNRKEEKLRSAVLSYMLVSNWTEARKVVENNPFLMTDEAVRDLHKIITKYVKNKSEIDPLSIDLSSILLLIQHSITLLKQTKSQGILNAFRDWEETDDFLIKFLEDLPDRNTLYFQISKDPSLLDDIVEIGLTILSARSLLIGNVQRYDQIFFLLSVINKCKDETAKSIAIEIQEQLSNKDPKYATPEDISDCLKALAFITIEQPSFLWAQLKIRLGILLMECPAEDRNTNLEAAIDSFREVIESFPREKDIETWIVAAHELLLCLVKNPSGNLHLQNEADYLFKDLSDTIRSNKEYGDLASTLSSYGSYLCDRQTGDQVENCEKALSYCKEAVDLIYKVENPSDYEKKKLGRFLHNLGVVYLKRSERGVQSENIDLAVNALREALEIRDEESDPAGRARTFRALANAYPGWSGADSLDHANELSHLSLSEAERLEDEDPRVKDRIAPRGSSALDLDLFELFESSKDKEKIQYHLLQRIEIHKSALKTLTRTSSPVEWSMWIGGLGVLMTGLFHTDNSRKDFLENAYSYFDNALDAISMEHHPRLWISLQMKFGELAHMIGDWQTSYNAYSAAVAGADFLLKFAGAQDSQKSIYKKVKGAASFAAYAAARLSNLSDAVYIAEQGCSRTITDLLLITERALLSLSPELRLSIEEKKTKIKVLEEELKNAEEMDPSLENDKIMRRLAEYLGISHNDPRLKSRIINPGEGRTIDSSSTEYSEISGKIALLRNAISEELQNANNMGFDVFPIPLTVDQISEAAKTAGHPIIYLMATDYGSMALFVLPDKSLDSMQLPAITSRHTNNLLYGNQEFDGYLKVANYGQDENRTEILERCFHFLKETLAKPIGENLKSKGYNHVYLIPLGTLGLLPLTSVFDNKNLHVNILPSSRAMIHCLNIQKDTSDRNPQIFAVGNPIRVDLDDLPIATAEVRTVCKNLEGIIPTQCLVGDVCSANSIEGGFRNASYLHFACHADFHPSNPLDSGLLLSGQDKLTIGHLFRNPKDLYGIKLVMLMACQTASKDGEDLPDESMNLATGMILAGVPSVVCTLWPVGDLASAMFSMKFYNEHLYNQKSVSVAFAEARDWLRNLRVSDVLDQVKSLMENLLPSDVTSLEVLKSLSDNLKNAPPESLVFPVEQWGAFAIYGL